MSAAKLAILFALALLLAPGATPAAVTRDAPAVICGERFTADAPDGEPYGPCYIVVDGRAVIVSVTR